MINFFSKIFYFLFLLLPIFLITGPAIPDLIITFSLIFLIILIFYKKKYYIFSNKLFLISIIFWLLIILISFFSYYKQTSFQDSIIFIRILLIPIIGYYFFFINTQNIKIVIYIIFLTVCFVLIDTLFQFVNYDSELGFKNDLLGFKSNWYGRLTGPFRDELIPGAYVSKFGLIGYLFFVLNKKNTYYYYGSIFYLSLIGVVCFASGERMALATYLLGLLILLIFYTNQRKKVLFSILTFLLLTFSIYKIHPFYNDYTIISSTHYHQGLTIEKKFNCKNDKDKICTKIINLQPSFFEVLKNFKSSAYGEIYLLSYEMFKENPLSGIGISNYEKVCKNNEKYNNLMKNYKCAAHPHNYYLQWLSEGGIIVFSFFLFYLFYLFYFIKTNSGEKIYKLVGLTSLVIIFWPVMSTGSLIKNWNGISIFFIISICLSLSKFKTKN
tara:strand:+ start:1327 stop:2646 length:1320 start_codon:yes stop_codon:yes gene_type:complete